MPSQATVLFTILLSEDHRLSVEGTAEALDSGGFDLCVKGASHLGASLRTSRHAYLTGSHLLSSHHSFEEASRAFLWARRTKLLPRQASTCHAAQTPYQRLSRLLTNHLRLHLSKPRGKPLRLTAHQGYRMGAWNGYSL